MACMGKGSSSGIMGKICCLVSSFFRTGAFLSSALVSSYIPFSFYFTLYDMVLKILCFLLKPSMYLCKFRFLIYFKPLIWQLDLYDLLALPNKRIDEVTYMCFAFRDLSVMAFSCA